MNKTMERINGQDGRTDLDGRKPEELVPGQPRKGTETTGIDLSDWEPPPSSIGGVRVPVLGVRAPEDFRSRAREAAIESGVSFRVFVLRAIEREVRRSSLTETPE